ncbi:uncharacterized protein LOC116351214 [Contarinia nasturtii]|uniref:uncharacterized protein LOC116351214 n=1 Tax=Contarinia nasturtii TaxID=265458 RepID=UPI0012D38336|nr:uncharacterized protein LOC116351214 [Contarinia nasturtii]
MPFPTVKSCCCLSLRTAGILIGICNLLINISSVYGYFHLEKHASDNSDWMEGWELVLTCILMPINITWICGIVKEKTKLMLPFFILSSIGVIVLVALPFGLLFYFSTINMDAMKGTLLFILSLCAGGKDFFYLFFY